MKNEAPRSVHFVAIGGTGMGSLAGLLHARGLRVTGSDDQLYPPMSTLLEGWGIRVHEGFRAENVAAEDPDLVVIGNAVRPDNPEAKAVLDEGLPYRSFSDALYELAIAGKHSVVVTGTHGKTTTTSLVGSVLMRTGCDPSLLVGGHALDFGGSFREGDGEHFVVEGDEYDTAFFDKTPKFLHYHPQTLVITSVEFDHADIYRDLDHVKDAFRTLLRQMPEDGTVIAAVGHEGVADVVRDARCRVVGYGVGANRSLDYAATDLEATEEGTRFQLRRPGQPGTASLVPLYGDHNLENAVAAVAVATELGVPFEGAMAALMGFRGVRRRLEVRGEAAGVTVLDDFAHHPTAVAATLTAVRARYPGRRIVAIFEPRTNTSRRKVFQQQYAEAFDAADRIVIREVPDTPIYSATGEVTEKFSAAQLAADLEDRELVAEAISDVDAIVDHVVAEAAPGDVAVVMSNGAFDGIWEKLLAALEA
ncbi:MAG: UDP-N-acetylmuramate:L-alanyl-gamma-D-glutamyl-meso-diaminopimelate ligase [Myxococcota bacterium]